MNVELNHSLKQDEALKRIKGLLNKLKNDYGSMVSELSERWNDNVAEFSFKAMGMMVEGTILVTDSVVGLDAKIPLAALPFKSTIEQKIKDEAEKLLS